MIHFLLGQKAYFANANCWFQGVYSKGLSSRKRSFTIFLFVAKTSRVENLCISTISFLSFRVIFHETIILGERGTPPKFNSSPLKNGGWKTFASPIGVGNLFRGELLIFGRGFTLPETNSQFGPENRPGQRPKRKGLSVFQQSMASGANS